MQRPLRGFTIVELLIVITVLGVLVTIVLLMWGGAIRSAEDKARENDVRQWANTFELYRGRYVVYPISPAVSGFGSGTWACLGTFASTGARCGQYGQVSYSYADSTGSTILTEAAKTGKLPANSGPKVDNLFVGPLLYIEQSSSSAPITVRAHFVNFFQQKCPSDFTNVTSTSPYSALKSGQGSNPTFICELRREFTYSPS